MQTPSIHNIACTLETHIENSAKPSDATAQYLRTVIAELGTQTIIDLLEAALPSDLGMGDLVVYRSEQITMLYGRVPAHFRSAIHDHTVFACIAQLSGQETSVIYKPSAEGASLRQIKTVTGNPGDVTVLMEDAIHHIENPTEEIAAALHVYGGDFQAVESLRSLWSHDHHVPEPFSMPAFLKQSLLAMKAEGNDAGLQGVARAMPSVKPLIHAL